MGEFTHIGKNGSVRMVDVTDKRPTVRTAIASASISMNRETFDSIQDHRVKKGNVLETARIAGVMAAKKTADLIPMCHPLMISYARVDFLPEKKSCSIKITAEVRLTGKTGVEMEALTAVSVAALTIYDMCKAYDKSMVISHLRLDEKSGGKSGVFIREEAGS